VKKMITVELYPPDGRIWRYDGAEDETPLLAWLLDLIPQLGAEFSNLSHNATIRVWHQAS
jgi:hypothetical protein